MILHELTLLSMRSLDRKRQARTGANSTLPHSKKFEEIKSFVGPNNEMQMIQMKHMSAEAPMKEAEFVAMGRMRAFCAKTLKALAPPLLRELEKVPAL
jgi:hypothetical protein